MIRDVFTNNRGIKLSAKGYNNASAEYMSNTICRSHFALILSSMIPNGMLRNIPIIVVSDKKRLLTLS